MNRLTDALAAVGLVLVAGASIACVATGGGSAGSGASEPPRIEGRFDVGGYELWISCAGTGSPTVVFDAGLGTASAAWSGIRPDVARTTRACVYDRAGIGESDARPGVRTSTLGTRSDELFRLLDAAGIGGPLVLVGHSYGGMVAHLTAHRRPDSVVGLVLVDSASRREMEGEWLANDVPWMDGATEVDRPTSAIELAAADDLGALPVVVLTQGRTSGQFAIEWTRLQDELAMRSSNTIHVVVDTGHMIQLEAPDVVKGAIAIVIRATRDRSSLPPCEQVFGRVPSAICQ